MKLEKYFLLVLPLLALHSPLVRADLNDAITNSSQLSEDTHSSHVGNGLLQSPIEDLSVTESEMFLGPSFHVEPTPAPPPGVTTGHHHATAGAGPTTSPHDQFSVRHVLSIAYEETHDFTISPVLDVSQTLSGPDSGKLALNDPQLKFSFKNFYEQSFMNETAKSGLMVSLYAPVSEMSRAKNSMGAISISFTPKVQFRESRFALSGLFSLKNGLYGRTNASDLISSQGMVGYQGNYRISHKLETFLMNYADFKMGAHIDMTDAALPSETFSPDKAGHTFGLMTGLKFDASKSIAITPRINWFMDQPIATSTVGLNLMIHLI